ncbi:hypothetical protein B0J12DRAFT_193405 [Macrophomina phaseolina]|uniref:Uncharacterized protein n=1 Tax=Macrophomina phaseolina TaxID=35725 RepID=A0ABQ8G3L3_9PEZI|nr:hypothetical protein B0J12DRAFT_193405 [Macrophomina phaseolina]
MVTHLSTNRPVRRLNIGERTGSVAFCDLWSYVVDPFAGNFYEATLRTHTRSDRSSEGQKRQVCEKSQQARGRGSLDKFMEYCGGKVRRRGPCEQFTAEKSPQGTQNPPAKTRSSLGGDTGKQQLPPSAERHAFRRAENDSER